jgi:hypothetical protein
MKNRFLYLLLSVFVSATSFAQITTKITTDSLRIQQVNGHPAELILENSTKGKTGAVLKNRINGRTFFDYVVDTVYQLDSFLVVKRGPDTYQFNMKVFADHKLDSIKLRSDSLFSYKTGVETFIGKATSNGVSGPFLTHDSLSNYGIYALDPVVGIQGINGALDSIWVRPVDTLGQDGFVGSADFRNFIKAYNRSIISGAYNNSTGVLTLNMADGSTAIITGLPTDNNQLANGRNFISSVTNFITADGTTMTRTGSGTLADPYVFHAITGGSGFPYSGFDPNPLGKDVVLRDSIANTYVTAHGAYVNEQFTHDMDVLTRDSVRKQYIGHKAAWLKDTLFINNYIPSWDLAHNRFENRSPADIRAILSLNNVENTALSTWPGSSNVVTLGTIATGTWHGTAIGDTYISSASTWNAKQAAISLTTTGTSGAATFSSNTLNIPNYTYTLPTATPSVLGGVKVGANLSIDGSGVLTATATATAKQNESDLIGRLLNSTVPSTPIAFHPRGFNEIDMINSVDSADDYEKFYDDRFGIKYIRFHTPSSLQSLVGTASDITIKTGKHFPAAYKDPITHRYFCYGLDLTDNRMYYAEGATITELQSATWRMMSGIPMDVYDFAMKPSPRGGFVATAVIEGQCGIWTASNPRGPWIYQGKIFDPTNETGDSLQLRVPQYATNQADPTPIFLNDKLYVMFNGISLLHQGTPKHSHESIVEVDQNTFRATGRPLEFIDALSRSMHAVVSTTGETVYNVGNPVFIQIQGRTEVWYIWSKGSLSTPDTGYIARIIVSDSASNPGFGGKYIVANAVPGHISDMSSNVRFSTFGTHFFNRDSAFVTTSGGNNGLWQYLGAGVGLRNFRVRCTFSFSSLPTDSATIFRIPSYSHDHGTNGELKLMVNSSGVKRLIFHDETGTQFNFNIPGTVTAGARRAFDLVWNADLGQFTIDDSVTYSAPSGSWLSQAAIYSLFNDSTDYTAPGHQMTGAIYNFNINLLPNINGYFAEHSPFQKRPDGLYTPSKVLLGNPVSIGTQALQVQGNVSIKTANDELATLEMGSTSAGYNGAWIKAMGAVGANVSNIRMSYNPIGVGQVVMNTLNGDSLILEGKKVILPKSDSDPDGGRNSAIYYNTTTNKFRIYEGGAWMDMVGTAGSYINNGTSLQTSASWSIDGKAKIQNTTATDGETVFDLTFNNSSSSAAGMILNYTGNGFPMKINRGGTGGIGGLGLSTAGTDEWLIGNQATSGNLTIKSYSTGFEHLSIVKSNGRVLVGSNPTDLGVGIFQVNGDVEVRGADGTKLRIGTANPGYNGGTLAYIGAGDGTATNEVLTLNGSYHSDGVGQLNIHSLSGGDFYFRGYSFILASTTSDPTGYNGAMYYNSSSGKFRVYQAGAWMDMVGSGGGGSIASTSSVLKGDGSGGAVAATAGTDYVTPTGTETLTNKRITKRSASITSNSATPSINTDSYDYVSITSQTANITSVTVSGTPTVGQTLWIAITASSGSPTISWGSSFEASGSISLPSTISTTRTDFGFVWNDATSKWRIVAIQ